MNVSKFDHTFLDLLNAETAKNLITPPKPAITRKLAQTAQKFTPPTTKTAPSLSSASTANTSTTLIIAHWTISAQHLLNKKK